MSELKVVIAPSARSTRVIVTELSPGGSEVILKARLLARQRLETEVRFASRRRAHALDPATHHDRAADEAARCRHLKQTRRAQTWMLREHFEQQRLVRVEDRRGHASRRASRSETRGLDGACDRVIADAELASDGADLPVLGVEEPTHLRALRLRDHRRSLPRKSTS